MLGNGRLEALCFDGEKRLAHIRGKLRKKVWINQGDIILLSLRDYQDEKGDVILKYSADEARSLKAYGELPETAKINETDTYVLPRRRLVRWDCRRNETDSLLSSDTAMRVWMTMSSLTRTETIAVTTRTSMLMRSEVEDGRCMSGFDVCMASEFVSEALDTQRWVEQASYALRRFKDGVGGAGYELMRHRNECC